MIRTIRGVEVLGLYEGEAKANKAFEDFQNLEVYAEQGLYLIRFDPTIIKVVSPK
jgi:hypothetical protein